MKRYKNLFSKICTFENFRGAYYDAIKNKEHYTEVKIINKDPDTFLKNLLKEVSSGSYKVSNYTVFNLWSGHKWREIRKLPMRDRIVQHAIMRIIEPIFRETFILDTYSSIKYRGVHLGLTRIKKYLKKNNDNYFLKLDIKKCYPSLDKSILKNYLKEKFKDSKLLNLLYKIVDSCDKGVPIGNYTSQYFENLYFNHFDHWLKEKKKIKGYFRYCDDMVIISNSKKYLHFILKEIKKYINKINLSLKSNFQISKISDRGINFLGYIIYKDRIYIRKGIKKNFIHKVLKMNFQNLSCKDMNVLGSYWGILKHANCRHLWEKYTNTKNFDELRIIFKKKITANKLLYKTIIVTKILFNKKSKIQEASFYINYKGINNVLVTTISKKLISILKNLDSSFIPFKTIIKRDKFNFLYFYLL